MSFDRKTVKSAQKVIPVSESQKIQCQKDMVAESSTRYEDVFTNISYKHLTDTP